MPLSSQVPTRRSLCVVSVSIRASQPGNSAPTSAGRSESMSPRPRCAAASGSSPLPCYRPLEAWQKEDGKIVFQELPDIRRALRLPCGKCIGCYLERSRVWAVRIMHESSTHAISSFVTLTYEEDKLPAGRSLCHKDFRLFMKRVRNKFGPTRFFMCGEYGSETFRPHFHACLFGVYFSDRVLFKVSESGSNIYTSKELSSLWSHGFSSVGDLTFESAAYVARYVVKKATNADIAYLGPVEWFNPVTGEFKPRVAEYAQMSRRPGIGFEWWRRYAQEVLNRGNVVMRGQEMKVPRYYAKLCSDPAFDWVEAQNQNKFKPDDNTLERLETREFVQSERIKSLKRKL